MSLKQLLRDDCNFIPIYKFTCCLPKEQSYMLSYLIDTEDFISKRLPDDEEYFMCDKEGFIDELLSGWSTYEITSAIKGLEKSGYLNSISKNDGFKKHTYIKLNYEVIKSLITEYKKVQLRSIKNLDSGVLKSDNNQKLNQKLIQELNSNEDKSSTLNKDKSLNLKNTSLNNTLNNKSNDIDKNILTKLNLNELSTNINDIELLINHLDLNDDLKKLMIDYFKARYKIKKSNLKQVLRKIKTVFKESSYDSNLVYETVELAYINNYQGWEPKWILDKRANYNNRNSYKNNRHIDDDLPSSAPKPGKKSVGNTTF